MKHIEDYLEPERVNAMLDAAKACSSRDYLMLRVLWRSGVRVSGLVNIRIKDIEWDNWHSYAINMIRNSVDIWRVQLLLGHAGIQTTTVYLQFKDADLRERYMTRSNFKIVL